MRLGRHSPNGNDHQSCLLPTMMTQLADPLQHTDERIRVPPSLGRFPMSLRRSPHSTLRPPLHRLVPKPGAVDRRLAPVSS